MSSCPGRQPAHQMRGLRLSLARVALQTTRDDFRALRELICPAGALGDRDSAHDQRSPVMMAVGVYGSALLAHHFNDPEPISMENRACGYDTVSSHRPFARLSLTRTQPRTRGGTRASGGGSLSTPSVPMLNGCRGRRRTCCSWQLPPLKAA